MKETDFTLNNATLVWWFIFWRVFLIAIGFEIVMQIFSGVIANSVLLTSLADWGVLLATVLVTIIFTQKAVNRDYRSKSNGSFRLAALELPETDTAHTFAPKTAEEKPADIPPPQ